MMIIEDDGVKYTTWLGLAVGVIVAAGCSLSPFVHSSVSVQPFVDQLAHERVGTAGLLQCRQDTCLCHVAVTVLLQQSLLTPNLQTTQ